MKIIKLTKGFEAKVDDDDFERVSKYRWHANHKGNNVYYAMRSKRSEGSKNAIYLHREIMNAVQGQKVDHVDSDPFNNQKSNLRFCSQSQNLANKRVFNRRISRFRGIYRVGKKWAAKCHRKYIGCFSTDIEAAKAFDKAAYDHFGQFATLNFPI